MQVILTKFTEDPENEIAINAAECYDGEITPEANANRIKKLIEVNHDSTYRFAYATFRILEISRVCSHQIVRTAHAGFLQRSQRYTYASKQRLVVIPDSFADAGDEAIASYMFSIESAFNAYDLLIKNNVKKEDARYILPEGIYTNLRMTGNFQMWRKWLKARLSKKAQWEIREVATQVEKQLQNIAPNIFRNILN